MGDIKDQAEGKIKQVKGQVTGDPSEQVKGDTQQAWGNVRSGDVSGAAGNVKDAAGAVSRSADTDREASGDTTDDNP